MANHLKMAMVNAITTLKSRGWSMRRIAQELGVDRGTVKRYVELEDAKPASKAPTGSLDGSKPATNAPLGSETGTDPPGNRPPGTVSRCAPFSTVIEDKLGIGLSAQRIYQDLITEHGYAGSYYSVRR